MKRKTKKHTISECPLYKAKSLDKVAQYLTIKPKNLNHPKYKRLEFKKLLNLTKEDLDEFANGNFYRLCDITDKKGKKRKTEVPVTELKLVHKRLVDLFSRIEPPLYLYSATKSRSYIDNGRQHSNGKKLFKIDIKKFFPSTLYGYVYNFFRKELKCEKHVATVLAKICTYEGHLPTGSPVSPILSFYAHKPMFDQIYQLASESGCIMTLYVDDIHISGDKATKCLLWKVKKIIHNHNLGYHKDKLYHENETKKVTGTIISGKEIRLRNCSHKIINEELKLFNTLVDPIEKRKLIKSLIGKVSEAKQLEPSFAGKAEYLRNQSQHLKKKSSKM